MDSEADFSLHLEVARRGAWVEYDKIGGMPVGFHVGLFQGIVGSGFGDRLLASHDAGTTSASRRAARSAPSLS